MTKKFLYMAVLSMMAATVSVSAEEKEIVSPDGQVTVKVSDEGGSPKYQVSLGGLVFIQPSALGLKMNFDDLTQGLTMKACDVSKFEDEYWLKTDIIFRVTGRDVAYRYKVYPKKVRGGETLAGVVESEASSFVMPEGTTTFLCPQMKPMTGFARTAPSYETGYTLDDAMGKNGWGSGYTFPCLFKTPGGWILLSEAGTDGNYVGCRLQNEGGALYRIGFPLAEEMNGVGSVTPAVSLPAVTPWRTITLGETLKPIVETTVTKPLEQNLAALDDLKQVTSVSSESVSVVYLTFEDTVNVDRAMLDIQQSVTQLKGDWPETVGTTTLLELSTDLIPTVVAAVHYKDMDPIDLSGFVSDKLIPALEGTNGVASVNATGLVVEEVQIELNKEKIDKLNRRLYDSMDEAAQAAFDKIDEGQQKIDEGRQELESARTELDKGQQALWTGSTAAEIGFRDARAELDKNKKELTDAIAMMEEPCRPCRNPSPCWRAGRRPWRRASPRPEPGRT